MKYNLKFLIQNTSTYEKQFEIGKFDRLVFRSPLTIILREKLYLKIMGENEKCTLL